MKKFPDLCAYYAEFNFEEITYIILKNGDDGSKEINQLRKSIDSYFRKQLVTKFFLFYSIVLMILNFILSNPLFNWQFLLTLLFFTICFLIIFMIKSLWIVEEITIYKIRSLYIRNLIEKGKAIVAYENPTDNLKNEIEKLKPAKLWKVGYLPPTGFYMKFLRAYDIDFKNIFRKGNDNKTP